MPDKARIDAKYALRVAKTLVAELEPVTDAITIAGSLRRQKPEVGDVEILCIPKFIDGVDQLDRAIGALVVQRILGFRRNKRGSRVYGPKNKLMVHLPSGIGVDIFSSTGENWGMALLIRTGPKEWNIRVMSRFRYLGMQGHAYGGVTDAMGKELNCPDEETVFQLLQWAYVPPEKRI